jgi:hypothetical protein
VVPRRRGNDKLQTIREKLKLDRGLSILGFVVLYWFVETLFCVFTSDWCDFMQIFFHPDLTTLYRRVIVICLFVMLGAHDRRIIDGYKQEAEDWMAYGRYLEQKLPKDSKPTGYRDL